MQRPSVSLFFLITVSFFLRLNAADHPSSSGSKSESEKNISITSTTISTAPEDKNTGRRRIGIGELVQLEITGVSHPEMTSWSISGPGYFNVTKDGVTSKAQKTGPTDMAFFWADDTAGTVTVTANARSKRQVTISFQVVIPSGEIGGKIVGAPPSEFKISDSCFGASAHINPLHILPRDVSFQGVFTQELEAQPEHVSGEYDTGGRLAPASAHDRAKGAFSVVALDANSDIQDQITEYRLPAPTAPYSPGGFTWNIASQYKVGANGTWHNFCSNPQVFNVATDGTLTISKHGKFASRSPGQSTVRVGP